MIWEEPARGAFPDAALFMRLSGLDQMRTFLEQGGPVPPLSYLAGILPTEVAEGTSTFTMPSTQWLLTPQSLVSGGALLMLADGPLGCAIQTTLPPATLYTTAEMSVNFLRPPAPDGRPLLGRGRFIAGGRALALSECWIEDADGRLIAHGTSRCFIFPSLELPPGEPPEPGPWREPEYETPHPYLRPVEGEVVSADTWERLSGLEILHAHLREELPKPPIYYLTGLRPIEATEGRASCVLPASVWLCPPTGMLQGGAIAMAADAALAFAVQTTVPAGGGYAPLDVKVHFVRPVPPDGTDLTATGVVVNRSRQMAVARAEVTNAAGKIVASASGSARIFDHPFTGRDSVAPADEVVASDA